MTTTTHKSLRGPRGAMIFYRKGAKADGTQYELEDAINFAVFPGLQGGPHNHTIAALATALKQCSEPGYVAYQEQVLANSASMANALTKEGLRPCQSGGTDNHLVLVDLKNSKKIDGARVEAVLESEHRPEQEHDPRRQVGLSPGGVRMGAPALTSRGFDEADFETVVELFDRGVQIALDVKAQGGKLKDFRQKITEGANAAPSAALSDGVGLRVGLSRSACRRDSLP